jgi:hypothetical protein
VNRHIWLELSNGRNALVNEQKGFWYSSDAVVYLLRTIQRDDDFIHEIGDRLGPFPQQKTRAEQCDVYLALPNSPAELAKARV